MCDQAKSIATSFMCGKDLDNYLRNSYYAGPFTQGTRMLNKYRTKNTNPCIDHYENTQFEGCCEAVKCNQAAKMKRLSQSKQKSNCGCNNNNNNKPQLCCSNVSSESDMSCPQPCPPPCPSPCPSPCEPKPGCENDDEENAIAKRCKQLSSRGQAFLTQIERTKLPTIVVDEDEYLPSIMGCGWQIAIKPKKWCNKSKFQVTAYDPYLMLHSWQEMLGITAISGDDRSRHSGGSNATTLKEARVGKGTEAVEADELEHITEDEQEV